MRTFSRQGKKAICKRLPYKIVERKFHAPRDVTNDPNFFGGYRDELRKQGVPKRLDVTCCSFLAIEEATQQMLRYKSVRYFIALTWWLLFRFLPFWCQCSSEIGHHPPVAATKFVCKPILIALYHRRWGSIRSSEILNNFHWAICNV